MTPTEARRLQLKIELQSVDDIISKYQKRRIIKKCLGA